jgi:hypothetical protein
MKSSPMASPKLEFSTSCIVTRKRTGVAAKPGKDRMRSRTTGPSRSGKVRLSSTTSGRVCSIVRSASDPFVTATAEWPSSARVCRMKARSAGSPSTTRRTIVELYRCGHLLQPPHWRVFEHGRLSNSLFAVARSTVYCLSPTIVSVSPVSPIARRAVDAARWVLHNGAMWRELPTGPPRRAGSGMSADRHRAGTLGSTTPLRRRSVTNATAGRRPGERRDHDRPTPGGADPAQPGCSKPTIDIAAVEVGPSASGRAHSAALRRSV